MKGEARGGEKTKDKRRVARSRMKRKVVTKREAGLVKRLGRKQATSFHDKNVDSNDGGGVKDRSRIEKKVVRAEAH